MIVGLSKKVDFVKFCADLSKKSESIGAVCIVAHFKKMVLFVML